MNLDEQQFSARARAFLHLFDRAAYSEQHPWKTLTGALLAQGDYSRCEMRGGGASHS